MHSWETAEFRSLKAHVTATQKLHLRDLLKDDARCSSMRTEFDGITLDYARQLVTSETMNKLVNLANAVSLPSKIKSMFEGAHLNTTEDRAVLHTALRAPVNSTCMLDGEDIIPKVHAVLQQICTFSEKVRNSEWLGATGKALTDVLCIGIGGSYLGPEFVHVSLRTDSVAAQKAKGRRLRFLANVDPVDVERSLEGLDREKTLVIIVSKTFTTAETITVRHWLLDGANEKLSTDNVIKQQFIAVSAAVDSAKEFVCFIFFLNKKNRFFFRTKF
eukprot:GSMAST32.ASY1.ANO1.2172.1 assembled CDS